MPVIQTGINAISDRGKMHYTAIIALLLVISQLVLCSSCYPQPVADNLSGPSSPVINQKPAKGEPEIIYRQVKDGAVFSLSLESNPSTGFDWTVKYDETMIEYLGCSNSPQAEIPKPGDQSYPDYSFKALKSGETKIILIYERSKEHGFSQNYVLKTVEMHVTIQDME